MDMTKQMKFVLAVLAVLAVQTYALVKEMKGKRDIAGSVVAAACELNVEGIPMKFNIGFAASQYVDYQYDSVGRGQKPEWLDGAVKR